MKDVQNQADTRQLSIDKVGIKNLRIPVTVLDKANGRQQTVAVIDMFVDLPHNHKGAHMSRFGELVQEIRPEFSLKRIEQMLAQMRERLHAQSAHISAEFPYFIEKTAPVSCIKSFMDYTCRFSGSSANGKLDLIVEVEVPVASVCPCSLEISDFGAHNQRGKVTLRTRFKKLVWIEDLVAIVERAASCDLFTVLKRSDEKFVTEKAFANPKFVEDIVRDVALQLNNDPNITWYEVSAENFESIHNHSAYAFISNNKR